MTQPLQNIKALTFDVFGTVVDWRTSVTTELNETLRTKLTSPSFTTLPEALQQRAQALASDNNNSWAGTFAAQWRASYGAFTKSFKAGTTPWKDIDTHHHESLIALLEQWSLAGLFTADETHALSLAWHRLQPWPDSAEGLRALAAQGLVTATLSNGNRALLSDLNEFGGLGFQEIISAEDFKAYKPDPKTYLGAAERVGCEPGEVAMVAAHLGDLMGARRAGLRTVYVEREGEEELSGKEWEDAKDKVDVWVGLGEGGFLEVARRLSGGV